MNSSEGEPATETALQQSCLLLDSAFSTGLGGVYLSQAEKDIKLKFLQSWMDQSLGSLLPGKDSE